MIPISSALADIRTTANSAGVANKKPARGGLISLGRLTHQLRAAVTFRLARARSIPQLNHIRS
jgi:hypothetical protein